MKKLIYIILLLLLPFTIFAYSEYIEVGGDTLGIEVNSKGVMVVGLYKINGVILNPELQVGDRIIKVNNTEINTPEELTNILKENSSPNKAEITYLRDNKEHKTNLNLSLYQGSYRTGLYVKGTVLGIGTLSYIDPNTGVYGLLGHSLNISNSKEKMTIRNGNSYEAIVTSFTRSRDGNPGSKNANIIKEKIFGNIKSNSNYGIFGKTSKKSTDNNLMKVGNINEVNLGYATILTTNVNNKKEEYEIKIIEIDPSSNEKNIYFEIVDKELLDMSGGIVQGMSGSPIIQDNKIIGAVTRVLIDEVNRGFGISIVTMLEEGDKIADLN